jgi:hypothetical protein
MRHKTTWTLALLLVAAPLASALELRRHQIPKELAGVFKEIEEELHDLRKDTRRRVLELKSELRDARSKITRMETQMTLLKIKLSALQATRGSADMAEPGEEGAPPAEGEEGARARPRARRPAPKAPPEPAVPPPAKLNAEIVDVQSERAGEFLTLSGSVKNTGTAALTFVIVKAVFLDREGKTVTKAATYTRPRVIAPKESASFELAVRADPRIQSHKLGLQAD